MLLLLMVVEGRDTGLTCKSLGQVWCVSLPFYRVCHSSQHCYREGDPCFGEKVCLLLFLRLLSMLVKTSSALCAGIVLLSRQWSFMLQHFLISALGPLRKLFPILHWKLICLQVCLPVWQQNNTVFSCPGHGLLPKWSFPPISWNAHSPAMSVQAVLCQSKRFWEQTFKWPLLLAWISDDRTRLCILIKTCPKFCGCEWFCWHQLETTCAWSLASAWVLCWIRAIVTIWNLFTRFVKKSTC